MEIEYSVSPIIFNLSDEISIQYISRGHSPAGTNCPRRRGAGTGEQMNRYDTALQNSRYRVQPGVHVLVKE